jgi:uncharacterized membrane protein YukC
MTPEYYVIAFGGNRKNKRRVKIEKADTIKKAENLTQSYGKRMYDTIIVEKNEQGYEIVPNGIWKIYRFMNKIFMLFGMILLAFLFYLYFAYIQN